MKSKSWGKIIKCKYCGGEGKSILDDGRLYFQCYGECQTRMLLKLYNVKK